MLLGASLRLPQSGDAGPDLCYQNSGDELVTRNFIRSPSTVDPMPQINAWLAIVIATVLIAQPQSAMTKEKGKSEVYYQMKLEEVQINNFTPSQKSNSPGGTKGPIQQPTGLAHSPASSTGGRR